MQVGTAQVDITPAPGVELSGFAARIQPSLGVLDPLYAKALYLEDAGERVVWVHCDLIGFDAEIVRAFRAWARDECGLDAHRVLLSATHTHSGPCTLRLHACGSYDPAYRDFLLERLHAAVRLARSSREPCDLLTAESVLALAVDRRGQPGAHVDPALSAIGFRRTDGTWKALLVNYAIHPVALGLQNRQLSTDLSGHAAAALSRAFPRQPVVLVTNGAAGNLNPPSVGVPATQVEQWGRAMADAIAGPLRQTSAPMPPRLRVRSRVVPLPLDVLDADAIDACAREALRNRRYAAAWGSALPRAVEHWRRLLRDCSSGAAPATRDVELHAIGLGAEVWLGINAEVFSRFGPAVRRATGVAVRIVGYANGVLGYLATPEAYPEGGYEVDAAHFFYGGFRFRADAFDQLVAAAATLVREVAPDGMDAPPLATQARGGSATASGARSTP